MTKPELGQYFTKSEILREKVYEFCSLSNNFTENEILEPSFGRGDLLIKFLENHSNVKFDLYEIDNTIEPIFSTSSHNVIYGDFLSHNINKTYNIIIGNPPYVKNFSSSYARNLYIDFIEKCFKLLNEDGQMIMIVPSDFLKLTSSSSLLNEMMLKGTFMHIFHPNNERLFENANIDVIVFRYQKTKDLDKILYYNDKLMYIHNSDGIITFHDSETQDSVIFGDYFEVFVGLVSGKEEVFKNKELGNVSIINSEEKIDKYILIDKFPTENEKINDYLLEHKEILLSRKIRKFNESNWFEFGALRNVSSINKHKNRNCIYISTLTRSDKVAFIGKVSYFGGNLLMLLPKYDINLEKVANYLNSDEFKHNYIFSGRFKIGHRQISNSLIPYGILE
jgi:adenine-specific DNA-methyltransferase